jgi:excisionase family DNA binding protein
MNRGSRGTDGERAAGPRTAGCFEGPARGGMTGRLLSPEEVARLCGLSRRAVYRAIERGELRASRLCSRLRVHADDLEAWRVANVVAPAPRAPARGRPRPPAEGGLRRLLAVTGEEEGS